MFSGTLASWEFHRSEKLDMLYALNSFAFLESTEVVYVCEFFTEKGEGLGVVVFLDGMRFGSISSTLSCSSPIRQGSIEARGESEGSPCDIFEGFEWLTRMGSLFPPGFDSGTID